MTSIAITSCGIMSAIGHDLQQVESSLRQGLTGIAPQHYLTPIGESLPVGEVKISNQEMMNLLGVSDEAPTPSRTALMGALALRQAIMGHDDLIRGARVALISGTTVGGMDVTESHFAKMREDATALQALTTHDCGSNTHEIAQLSGLTHICPNCQILTISTACSSALNAIMTGADMLRSGEVDIVIAGGAESLSHFHMAGFQSLMIVDNEPCRPFCATRKGLNLGEGAAFVVLQRTADYNPEHWGYVAGYGNRCDAYHQTATSPEGEGAYLAITDALQMARLSPSAVDYVNAHGTSTPDNDRSESRAIQRVFGTHIPPVSSTKGMTGHTTSASGAIELVICLLAMRGGFLPQNVGFSHPFEGGITPVTEVKDANLRYVLCNSFGFGGNDSSLLISSQLHALEEYSPIPSRVVSEDEISDPNALSAVREYVSPLEGRRMSHLLKAATLTSMRALQKADIESPDAIIVGTSMGMLENSEKQLLAQVAEPEATVSPMLFMQSTHNTIAGSLAIRTKCYGYNITYTQGEESEQIALADARRLLHSGKAKNVLVCIADEATPLYNELRGRLGLDEIPTIHAHSYILSI